MTDDPELAAKSALSEAINDGRILGPEGPIDTKLDAALQRVTDEASKITSESREAMLGSLAECANEMRRATKRAEALPPSGGYEVVEIVQDRGPTIEFHGKLLGSAEFDTRKGGRVEMELWQTRGGGIVGIITHGDHVSAKAFDLGDYQGEMALRFAVMDFFAWDVRARSMVTKKLGWSLRKDVE